MKLDIVFQPKESRVNNSFKKVLFQQESNFLQFQIIF